MQLADTHAIFISAAKGSVIGRNTFQRVTGLKQVKLGFWVVREKFYQRIAEALPQAVLHKGSAALATKQQALCFEALNRLTQRGT
ncbi:Uncharacterised protein [Enterobacter kobei]|nr:Uncharacterised protein [Enterobacter kobei]